MKTRFKSGFRRNARRVRPTRSSGSQHLWFRGSPAAGWSATGGARRFARPPRSQPSNSPPNQLAQLARAYGIELSYRDMAGKRRQASPETLQALLAVLEVPVGSPRAIADSLHAEQDRAARQVLPVVVVAWDGKATPVRVRLRPELFQANGACRLLFEDGRCKSIDWRPEVPSEPVRPQHLRAAEFELLLPGLPFGYHKLTLEIRERVYETLVISAPALSYAAPGTRSTWGAFVPVYAVHSQTSWGAGNLGDWRALNDYLAGQGANVTSTLPLLAAFLDSPCEPSPYSPVSRMFWNEFYLDIAALPEFATSPAAGKLVQSRRFAAQIQAARKAEFIDYRSQMALRRRVLEKLSADFWKIDSPRRQQFERLLAQRPALVDYACFRAAMEKSGTNWRRWNERMRWGKLEPGDYTPSARDYHLYVQCAAEEQISTLAAHCQSLDIELCLDVPVGVHPDGYDVWRERDAFACPATAGAPPDPFFTRGQDWGFAPLHPRRVRQREYRHVLEFLRFQMRHARLLRLDHIMGLHRLYWIPPGFPATDGAYVRYPADEFYALLCLESHRNRTRLVGENLGTVPKEVNEAMHEHGVRETYVVQYEQRPDPEQALRPPPREAVMSVNTHDMPAFAAHWKGSDLEDRASLGLIPGAALPGERLQREKLRAALLQFLQTEGYRAEQEESASPVLDACLGWLAKSPAEVLLLTLEDLWGEERPQNVPGTACERPNWRRKSRLSVEQVRENGHIRQLLARINRMRRRVRPSRPIQGRSRLPKQTAAGRVER